MVFLVAALHHRPHMSQNSDLLGFRPSSPGNHLWEQRSGAGGDASLKCIVMLLTTVDIASCFT